MTTGGRARTGSQREELVAFLGLASRLPGPWAASSAAIGLAAVVVTAANSEWTVHLHVPAHAVRSHRANSRKVEYAITVTISGVKLSSTRAGRARVRAWQRGVTRQLRSLGYKGRWADSGGPFAYFEKAVASLARIPVAVTKLQRVRF